MIRISDEAPHCVGPHLDPNCLLRKDQQGSTYTTSGHRDTVTDDVQFLPITFSEQFNP